MAFTTADFHYLTILRELEKETTRLERRRKSSERGKAHRTSRVFRDLFGELGGKMSGDSITLKLKASSEKLLEAEMASADLIRELTEGRPRLERIAAGDWPPVVPAPRMVERFTALTIGLHSEDPSQKLTAHTERAFKAAVLPALAWGLVSSLYELPEDLRGEAQAELARLFAGPRKPHRDELILNDDERVPFLYLRMVEAWFNLLDSSHPWGETYTSSTARTAVRSEIVTLVLILGALVVAIASRSHGVMDASLATTVLSTSGTIASAGGRSAKAAIDTSTLTDAAGGAMGAGMASSSALALLKLPSRSSGSGEGTGADGSGGGGAEMNLSDELTEILPV
jgi:hypothetical protein